MGKNFDQANDRHDDKHMGRTSDAKERLMAAISELIWIGSYGSTTIDQICEKAGVKKGSFYYFFDSKSELAVAAIEAEFCARRAELDAIFSPMVPPLERIIRLCDSGCARQVELKEKFGQVLGCPLFTLGSEICTQEKGLREKIREVLDCHQRYIASAVREAHAAGLIDAPDADAKARMLTAYFEGVLTQARILNSLEVLKEIPEGVLSILGAKRQNPVPV